MTVDTGTHQRPHHRREQRRLAPRRQVRAAAVRDVANRLLQEHKIVDHPGEQFDVAVAKKSEAGEVRVPVEQLVEPAAGDHVWMWKRKK